MSTAIAAGDVGGQAVAIQNDAAHDGDQPDPEITLPLTQRWSVDLGDVVSYPVVVGNVVYVTAGSHVYAIDLSTGDTIWQTSNTNSYHAMGLAYDNGQLYVTDENDNVSALDPATGATLWTQALSEVPPGQSFSSTPPTASNGRVYATGDGQNANLYALSETTGNVIWNDSVAGESSSPAVSSSGVYVAYACSGDYDFDPTTGDLDWSYTTTCQGGDGMAPALSGGKFYGVVGEFDASAVLSASNGQSAGTFSSATTPAIANGDLYTMSSSNTGGTLEAISDDGLGTSAWTFTGDGGLDTPPLVAGDVVYVGSNSGEIYALNATTGSVVWSASAGTAIDGFYQSLAVANRSLIVPAGNQLTAFADTPYETTSGTVLTGSSSAAAQVSLTATVTPTDGNGTVSFYSDGAVIEGCSSVSLSSMAGSGTASCQTSSLPGGANTVLAEYTGDPVYSSSLGSNTINVTGAGYTWSGGNPTSSPYWSSEMNWAGDRQPGGLVGTLTFPDLTSSACSATIPVDACYTASNNVPGMTADRIDVDSDNSYDITGDAVTLGAGGLSVSSPNTTGNASRFGLPISLGAPQTWSISSALAVFSGAVTGNETLGLDFTGGGSIQPSDIEVGAITASGEGGFYLDGDAKLNSSDASTVSVSGGAGIEADQTNNSVGPVAVGSTGWISIGDIDNGGGTLAVDGNVNFSHDVDPSDDSKLDLAVDSPGTDAGSDYSQLTATGSVNLTGANLDLFQNADVDGYCDDLEPGDTLTLVDAAGGLGGSTFANEADGASVDITNDCPDGTTSNYDAFGTIHYSADAVTLTITDSGDAGGGPAELAGPTLSGNPEEGQTLQTTSGSWLGQTSLTYTWYECDESSDCDQIPDATSSMFVPTADQVGLSIYAEVTVTDANGGTNYDDTDNSAVVTAEPVPAVFAAPTVSPGTTVGDILNATTGIWANAPTSYSYQWARCTAAGTGCNAIPGAATVTYTLAVADIGSTIKVGVTATNYGGVGSPSNSAATTPVSAAPAASTTPSAPTAPSTPPATIATRPSASAVGSALKTVLKPTGKDGTPKEILKLDGYSFTFKAPTQGKLTVVWVATFKHKTVTIASGRSTASTAGKHKDKIALTAKGKSAIKLHPKLKITATLTFTTAGLSPVKSSSRFRL